MLRESDMPASCDARFGNTRLCTMFRKVFMTATRRCHDNVRLGGVCLRNVIPHG
jgi:hypothetical protein